MSTFKLLLMAWPTRWYAARPLVLLKLEGWDEIGEPREQPSIS